MVGAMWLLLLIFHFSLHLIAAVSLTACATCSTSIHSTSMPPCLTGQGLSTEWKPTIVQNSIVDDPQVISQRYTPLPKSYTYVVTSLGTGFLSWLSISLQYYLYCVLVSLISSAVFLQVSSILKLMLLLTMGSLFMVFVLVTNVNLFDNRDFLLYAYIG